MGGEVVFLVWCSALSRISTRAIQRQNLVCQAFALADFLLGFMDRVLWHRL